jgi:GNAT superfamily N-acetyltransferase
MAVMSVRITAEAAGLWRATAPDGRPLGTAALRFGEATVEVEPGERRRGVGTALLDAVLNAAGGTVTVGPVEEGSPGEAFLVARGLTRVLALTYTRLELADAASTSTAMSGYRLVDWVGVVPGEWAATFVRARRAMDDMPMDDAVQEPEVWDEERNRTGAEAVIKRGDVLLTVAAIGEDGEIAGFTELVMPGGGTGDGQHYGTGVLPEHRGHGLARWMKAETIRLVRERHPALGGLLADTADSNAHMRRINDELGYRPTHRSALFQTEAG